MSVSPRVERLVADLEACADITSAALAAALAATPLEPVDLDPWVSFDARNYRRNSMLRRPGFELRVLCWLPGQRTSMHAHGRSACAFRVIRGVSTEIRLGQSDARWEPGAVVAEDSPGLVHQITNLGGEPLVSLHAYAPALPIDQPPASYEGRHVVIIGGGVSGVALAIHLLRSASGALRVTIVERRPSLGRGPAYGTSDPAFRLNVPAGHMSVLPGRPDDFVEWARASGTTVDAAALLPRQLFGAYVEARLADAVAGGRGKLWFHRSEAVAASADGVTLADGTFLAASAVVLATGNQLPAAPAALSPELLRSARVVGDPWSDGALAGVAADEELLLVGSGLTAIDVLLALRNQGHRGRIVVTSRHGLLPRPHLEAQAQGHGPVELDPELLPRDLRSLCRHLRGELGRAAAAGIPWQRVIDALRPHTTAIWRSLPLAEQRSFMARVRPYWEVLRHRAAADSLAVVEAWRASGQVLLVPGRIVGVAEDAGLRVEIVPRGADASVQLCCDRLILCTGPQTDVRAWPGALYRHLLAEGLLQADPLGLGVVTDASGRAVDVRGAPSPWLFTLGALRRAHLWETTAVPDIVRQAAALAELLGEG